MLALNVLAYSNDMRSVSALARPHPWVELVNTTCIWLITVSIIIFPERCAQHALR
jgi:hypothetical protein